MGLFALFNTAMAAQGAASKSAVTPAPEAAGSPRPQALVRANDAPHSSPPVFTPRRPSPRARQ